MPKRCLITHAHVSNVMELADELSVLTRARLISRRQWATLHAALAPELPASFVIEMRTPKGMVYLVTQSGERRVDCRAKLQQNS